MKKLCFCLILVFLLMVTGCGNVKDKFIGIWNYHHVSDVNGGTTDIDLYLYDDNTCKFDMKYVLLDRKILDNTSICTWEIEDEYIVIKEKNSINYYSYDSNNDIIYKLNKNTKTKEDKYTRK